MQKSGQPETPHRKQATQDDRRGQDYVAPKAPQKHHTNPLKGYNEGYVPYEDALFYQGAKATRNNSASMPYSETNKQIQGKQADAPRESNSKGGNRGSKKELDEESDCTDGECPRDGRCRRRSLPQPRRSRNLRSSSRSGRPRARSRRRSVEGRDPRTLPTRPSEAYTPLKAAKCAALGAALEAFRARNEPGPWMGQKGERLALAAAAGAAVGSVRGGQLQSSGALPYAEALCTGFFAVEWYKKIGRHTEHAKKAKAEREEWAQEYEKRRDRVDEGATRKSKI